MQRRMLTVLGAAIIAVFVGGIWFVARSSEEGDRRLLRYGRRRYRPNPVTLPITPSVMVTPWGSGGGTAAAGDTRIIANLADRAGPLVVSVQQIYAADRLRTILEPSSALGGPVGRFQLSLRAYRPDAPSTGEAVIDSGSLSIVDSTGRSLRAVDPPAPLAAVLRSAVGSTHTFFVEAPAPEAVLLRSVRGRVRLVSESSPSWSFEIRNVPLPNAPRLYGEVSYVRVQKSGGLAVLTGPSVDEASSQSPGPGTAYPPLRVILPVGVPTSLVAFTSGADVPLSIAAQPEATGHILVTGATGRRSWQVRVWDYEPFVIALPAGSGTGRIGVWLRTSRSDRQVLLSSAQVVYPAQRGRPAGSIAVRITGPGSRPFGPALVPVDIRRFADGAWTGAASVLAPVRSTGLAVIGNLAPGTYRLTFRLNAAQLAGSGVTLTNIDEYVRRRYGVARAVWTGGVMQELSVAAGSRVYGRPVVLGGPRLTGLRDADSVH